MYPVSEEFLQAVQDNTRSFYWAGKITTKTAQVYEFSNEDIVKGSGYITSQCCGNTEIEIGTVYAAELGITLFSDIDRYTLEDGKIEIFYHLLLADGKHETVPMGIFEISEANRTINCLEIKAYDYMLRFEKNFNGYETAGNAYAFLSLCCKACDVELNHTREEIESMPNGSEMLSVYPENDIETYRDVLFYVGQVLGGFFCINREGNLELRKYGNQPVITVSDKHRFSSSFSDFITRYTAINSTNLRTQIAEYYAVETDDGLTLNLGVNPLLQFGLEETRKNLLTNILTDLSVIRYVPFDSDTIGNPALNLGDVLVFSGGHADSSQLACVTGYQMKIGGKHSLKCVGKNPRLAQAKSKNDKNISGLLNQVEAGKIGIHTFTNASAYSISNVNTRIISIEFASSEENHAQFLGQIVVDVRADPAEKTGSAKGTVVVPVPSVSGGGKETIQNVTVALDIPVYLQDDGKAVASIIYEFNDEVIKTHYPVETWGSGKHILSLYFPIKEMKASVTNTFNVYLRIEGGTGTVEMGDCLASISGQAMAAAAAWDGKVTIEESVKRFGLLNSLKTKALTDELSYRMIEEIKRQMEDSMRRASIGSFGAIVGLGGEEDS